MQLGGVEGGVEGGLSDTQGTHSPRPLRGVQKSRGHAMQIHGPPSDIGEYPSPCRQFPNWAGRHGGLSDTQGTHAPRTLRGVQKSRGHAMHIHGPPGDIVEYPSPCRQLPGWIGKQVGKFDGGFEGGVEGGVEGGFEGGVEGGVEGGIFGGIFGGKSDAQGTHAPRPFRGGKKSRPHLMQLHGPPGAIGEYPCPGRHGPNWVGKQIGSIEGGGGGGGCGRAGGVSDMQGTHPPRPSKGVQKSCGHFVQAHGAPGVFAQYPIPFGHLSNWGGEQIGVFEGGGGRGVGLVEFV